MCRRVKVPDGECIFVVPALMQIFSGGGQVFYKLAHEDGWIFKKTATGRDVVEELTRPPLEDDCMIM